MTKIECGPRGGCLGPVLNLLCGAAIVLAIGFVTRPGLAQSKPGQPAQATGQQPLAQAAPRDFDIPAQPLTRALTVFGDQAGMQVTVDTDILAGRTSPSVSGRMAPAEALGRLLSGTGIIWRYADPTTLVLSDGGNDGTIMLGPVKVEGRRESAYGPVQGYVANRTATATKTDTPISEVPQSVTVVTRDQIDARAARTVAEALAYSAGVATGLRGESSSLGDDNIVIRGFGGTGTLNEYWDGLKIIGTNFATSGIEPYLFERVEVLRGPTSVLYGQNSPGGLVNSVSKRPPERTQGEVQVLGGSFELKELNLDVGGPLGTDGDVSYRLVGVASDQEAQTDFSGRERAVVSPGISWRPFENTTLTLQSMYQKDDANGRSVRTVPALGSLFSTPNGKIPRERYTGDPNYDKWDREIFSTAYILDHSFSGTWSARQNARYLHTDFDMETVYGRSPLSPDGRTIARSAFGVEEESDLFLIDNQLVGSFETGVLSHNLLLGADFQYREGSTFRRFAAAPPLDLYSPVYFQDIPEPPVFQDVDDQQFEAGLYVQNQIRFQRWILTLGGRHDWAESETTDNRTGTTSKSRDSAFTGRLGLGYAFDNGLTPYLGFAQSFQPQSGIDFGGNAFDPTEGEQFEAGVKYAVPGRNAFLTLAVFELAQRNVLTSDPVNAGFRVQTGEIRSRGIELEGVASLESGWDLAASYTYLDQEITKSNDNDLGKRPKAVPRQTASLWASYGFEAGWWRGTRVGGGVRYVGRSEGDALNTFHVPSYTLFDASLAYDMSVLGGQFANWHVAINATNLADKTYVASCTFATSCYYGIGRSVIARLKYQW